MNTNERFLVRPIREGTFHTLNDPREGGRQMCPGGGGGRILTFPYPWRRGNTQFPGNRQQTRGEGVLNFRSGLGLARRKLAIFRNKVRPEVRSQFWEISEHILPEKHPNST